ncbi:hypothetical protein B0H17DRAFT_1190641 [Mycena rosella]|uniref:Uncharacterized protein n=1 Tax=Mycena rosella TaxID=1033263 RepID=A0AAD7MCP1_MYCRO|nr:hypothetical protein B0H17DRAFT_1190641 [Mycena rosella]
MIDDSRWSICENTQILLETRHLAAMAPRVPRDVFRIFLDPAFSKYWPSYTHSHLHPIPPSFLRIPLVRPALLPPSFYLLPSFRHPFRVPTSSSAPAPRAPTPCPLMSAPVIRDEGRRRTQRRVYDPTEHVASKLPSAARHLPGNARCARAHHRLRRRYAPQCSSSSPNRRSAHSLSHSDSPLPHRTSRTPHLRPPLPAFDNAHHDLKHDGQDQEEVAGAGLDEGVDERCGMGVHAKNGAKFERLGDSYHPTTPQTPVALAAHARILSWFLDRPAATCGAQRMALAGKAAGRDAPLVVVGALAPVTSLWASGTLAFFPLIAASGAHLTHRLIHLPGLFGVDVVVVVQCSSTRSPPTATASPLPPCIKPMISPLHPPTALAALSRTIFAIQDEPPTWPGADDEMGLESISDPEETEDAGVDDGDVSSASDAVSTSSNGASTSTVDTEDDSVAHITPLPGSRPDIGSPRLLSRRDDPVSLPPQPTPSTKTLGIRSLPRTFVGGLHACVPRVSVTINGAPFPTTRSPPCISDKAKCIDLRTSHHLPALSPVSWADGHPAVTPLRFRATLLAISTPRALFAFDLDWPTPARLQ